MASPGKISTENIETWARAKPIKYTRQWDCDDDDDDDEFVPFVGVGCRVSSAIAILLQKFFTFTSYARRCNHHVNTEEHNRFSFSNEKKKKNKIKTKSNNSKKNGSRNKLVHSLVCWYFVSRDINTTTLPLVLLFRHQSYLSTPLSTFRFVITLFLRIFLRSPMVDMGLGISLTNNRSREKIISTSRYLFVHLFRNCCAVSIGQEWYISFLIWK